jgi:sialic acid synthase SpsE
VAATALGASIIEKHFTLDNELQGYDHEMSESPETFRTMITQIKMTHDALGNGDVEPLKGEAKKLPGVRRSLYWDGSYDAGERVEPNMLIEMRPGEGLRPGLVDEIEGRNLLKDVADGTLVHRSQIDWRDR